MKYDTKRARMNVRKTFAILQIQYTRKLKSGQRWPGLVKSKLRSLRFFIQSMWHFGNVSDAEIPNL